MVSLKMAAGALSAMALVGVDAGPCRPTSTTSGSSLVTTETASVATSTSSLTLSTDTATTLTTDTTLTTAPTDTTTGETSITATTTAAPQPTCSVLNLASAGQTCAQYTGVALSPNAIIGPGDASSLEACADSCTQTPGCVTLSFGSGLCTLLKQRQSQFGIFNQEPKQTFYDIECFAC